jgi:hypothetical protein
MWTDILYTFLTGKPESKGLLGRPRCRWCSALKMRQNASPKRWLLPLRRHGDLTQKNIRIVTAVKTLNLRPRSRGDVVKVVWGRRLRSKDRVQLRAFCKHRNERGELRDSYCNEHMTTVFRDTASCTLIFADAWEELTASVIRVVSHSLLEAVSRLLLNVGQHKPDCTTELHRKQSSP